ncbi:MAG: protein of unknown function toxins and related Ca2+-binding protein, partial [Rhizobium sp.]|nr:protein of unknown function toxins and related Ca2+-binding protein [Rhizobium sp.]
PTGTASAVLAAGTEDTAYVVSAANLLAGFSDVEGDTLSVSGLTASDGATVVDNGNGTYTITPATNDNGTVTLSYNVVDGNGGSVAASNTVNFSAVNDAPTGTASAVLAAGTEDTTYVVSAADLLTGFSDVEGDTLSVDSLTASDGATVVDNGNGTYTITPATNDNGTVTLSYNVVDGNGGSVAASNTVNFAAVNDPVTGAPTAVLTDGTEDTAYIVNESDLTAGFADADGDTLSVNNLVASGGATVVDNLDGTYTVTPAANFNGTVTLTYDVTDGNGSTIVGAARTVDFDAVNDAPVVAGVADIQVLDNSGSIFPSFAVSDVEGDFGAGSVLTVSSVGGADNFGFNATGNVSVAANVVLVNGVGVGTFTPLNGFGSLTITFNEQSTEANIEAVAQAITISLPDNSGTATVSVTLTDSDGATNTAVTADVLTTISNTTTVIDDLDGDSQVTGIANAALAVDESGNADTNYVTAVGLGNVNDVKLTITLGGDNDPSDLLAIPTALSGNGSIANISGNLVYKDSGGNEYNVGTVTTTSTSIVVSLSNALTGGGVNQTGFDAVLELVMQSTTVDAGNDDGVREVTFTIDGVGTATATATANLVVTSGGTIGLTVGIDNDASLSPDPTGINVFDAAVGELETIDNFNGGSTAFDILTAVLANASSVAPTIGGVEDFNISSAGAATISLANVTNTNDMELNLTGSNDITVTNIGSTFTDVDASAMTAGAVDLTTVAGQDLDIVGGPGLLTVTANDNGGDQAAIDIDATAANATIDINGSADFMISGTVDVNVDASGTTDSVTIASIIASSTVTAGTAALTITDTDVAATVNVAAGAMADNTALTIGGDGTLVITALEGTLNLSTYTGGNASVGFDDVTDNATSVVLGALAAGDAGADFSVTASTSGDAITIDATAAVTVDANTDTVVDADENVDISLAGAGTFVVNGLTADVNASTATGAVTLNTLAAANIAVTTGSDDTNIRGAATLVTIAAGAMNGAGDAITIGTNLDDFAGDVAVTGLDSGSVDATYLTGDLSIAVAGANTTATLGTGVTSLTVDAGGGADDITINALGFAGTATLSGDGFVQMTNVGSITIDGDDSTITDDDFAGGLDITLRANAAVQIIAGIGSIAVDGGDADGADVGDTDLDGSRGSVSINAAEMSTGDTIEVNDSTGGFNLNVTVTSLGNGTTLDLSGSAETESTATVSVTTAALTAGQSVSIELGTHETVSVTSAGSATSTVNIDAAAALADDFDGDRDVVGADSNAQLTLSGSSRFVVTNNTADVDASAMTGGVSITSGAGNQSLTGGTGADTLIGGANDDVIIGGGGADRINGGAGVDLLTGDAGADTFVFVSGDSLFGAATRDHITDFAINTDVIDISSGTFANIDNFNDLLISIGVGSTVITLDVNNNGVADAADTQITLDGNYVGQSFSGSDFVF